MPESSLQWVVTGYALTFGGFLLLGGRAADLLGRRRVMMAGLAVFTASSLGCALATSQEFLIAMRCVQGLGAGDRPAGGAVDRDEHVPRGRRAEQALGAWGAIAGSGATVGLIAGGLLTPLRRLAVHLLPQRPDRRVGAAARPACRARKPARHGAPAL